MKQVAWIREDTSEVLTLGAYVWADDHRINLQTQPSDSQWNLILRPVIPADAGSYSCQTSHRPDGRTSVQLVVEAVKD